MKPAPDVLRYKILPAIVIGFRRSTGKIKILPFNLPHKNFKPVYESSCFLVLRVLEYLFGASVLVYYSLVEIEYTAAYVAGKIHLVRNYHESFPRLRQIPNDCLNFTDHCRI